MEYKIYSDPWVSLVLNLYDEIGERGTLKILNEIEKEPSICRPRSVAVKEEDIEGWVNGLFVPSDGCGFYLACNASGDKYPVRYDERKKRFHDGHGYEGVVAYIPIKNEKERKILRICCGRKNCRGCAFLRKEDGQWCCRYEEICGDYRLGEWMPGYRVPMWKGKPIRYS